MDFQSLKETHQKIKKIQNKNDDFDKTMSEAMYLIDTFYKKKLLDKSYLDQATDKLILCSEIRPSNHESYVYLAFISFIFNNINLANDYLLIASKLSTDSELVKSFREQLLSSQNVRKISRSIDLSQPEIHNSSSSNLKVSSIKRVQKLQ